MGFFVVFLIFRLFIFDFLIFLLFLHNIGVIELRFLVRFILRPLARMGQAWEQPIGPDGWSEKDADWITPQGIAARVTWAMEVPRRVTDPLPDPRVFVGTTLGDFADETVRFAAAAAESKAEAIGIVLMSPAFQRR